MTSLLTSSLIFSEPNDEKRVKQAEYLKTIEQLELLVIEYKVIIESNFRRKQRRSKDFSNSNSNNQKKTLLFINSN